MALIDSAGQILDDRWTYPDCEGDGKVGPNFVLSIESLTAWGAEPPAISPLGAYVGEGTTADEVAPFLDRVDLVVVAFPKFRDGRGFTVARTLREKYGFKGDIRAIGHVLPDQLAALVRCGFSTIVTPREHPPSQWAFNAASKDESASAGPLLRRLIAKRATQEEDVDEAE
ncbi:MULTISPECIES: DUF934 domain-containing protein [unclassified Sinorhizobium]|uniref:DUF934 domain-containing protein n=1 Tax=unclassified Sinorhizobium TaxID=2613772 RepID=UPI0024C369BB|nr:MULTISPECIES: DUF934 domain-containing protein [unclassified Sinorhizobium]MDK1376812.1 DUF934 domain-containing protein [Sinorhizobium sp. 6-70]MDK1481087.1 DUF934 domain-containing protein [Sinorhizobium sp. 6-117]